MSDDRNRMAVPARQCARNRVQTAAADSTSSPRVGSSIRISASGGASNDSSARCWLPPERSRIRVSGRPRIANSRIRSSAAVRALVQLMNRPRGGRISCRCSDRSMSPIRPSSRRAVGTKTTPRLRKDG